MKRVCIVIPAHNESGRIGKTLKQYGSYFNAIHHKNLLTVEFLVVLNGCTDSTRDVVETAIKHYPNISILRMYPGRKRSRASCRI